MTISIIIPTYNRKELLQRCLNSIMHQDYPKDKYEIIVIDDGSSDETKEYLEIERPKDGENIVVMIKADKGKHGKFLGFGKPDK